MYRAPAAVAARIAQSGGSGALVLLSVSFGSRQQAIFFALMGFANTIWLLELGFSTQVTQYLLGERSPRKIIETPEQKERGEDIIIFALTWYLLLAFVYLVCSSFGARIFIESKIGLTASEKSELYVYNVGVALFIWGLGIRAVLVGTTRNALNSIVSIVGVGAGLVGATYWAKASSPMYLIAAYFGTQGLASIIAGLRPLSLILRKRGSITRAWTRWFRDHGRNHRKLVITSILTILCYQSFPVFGYLLYGADGSARIGFAYAIYLGLFGLGSAWGLGRSGDIAAAVATGNPGEIDECVRSTARVSRNIVIMASVAGIVVWYACISWWPSLVHKTLNVSDFVLMASAAAYLQPTNIQSIAVRSMKIEPYVDVLLISASAMVVSTLCFGYYFGPIGQIGAFVAIVFAVIEPLSCKRFKNLLRYD